MNENPRWLRIVTEANVKFEFILAKMQEEYGNLQGTSGGYVPLNQSQNGNTAPEVTGLEQSDQWTNNGNGNQPAPTPGIA